MSMKRSAMRQSIIICCLLFCNIVNAFATDNQREYIRLLDGYSFNKTYAIDATAWSINRSGESVIYFEAGLAEGSWANPKHPDRYTWYREQTIGKYQVRFALTKPGVKTQFDLE